MNVMTFFTYLLVMAGVTYLVRAVPFVLVKEKIDNPYVSAFLDYIPYAVLASMTIPAIFSATASVEAAVAGFVVAVIMACFDRTLITVALSASLAVLVVQLLL